MLGRNAGGAERRGAERRGGGTPGGAEEQDAGKSVELGDAESGLGSVDGDLNILCDLAHISSLFLSGHAYSCVEIIRPL